MVLNSKVVLVYYLPDNGDEVAVEFPVKAEFQYLNSHQLHCMGTKCVDQDLLTEAESDQFREVVEKEKSFAEIDEEELKEKYN